MGDWLSDRVIRAVLGVLRLVPFDLQRDLGARFVASVIAPVAGFGPACALRWSCPTCAKAEVRRMTRAVPANMGRALVELYSPGGCGRVRDEPFVGPGVRRWKRPTGRGAEFFWSPAI